jgi:hypothetical protein
MKGAPPREWAPYLQRRAMEHRPLIVASTNLVAAWLLHADRLPHSAPVKIPSALGAAVDRSGPVPVGRLRLVWSMPALAQAVATAEPGDVIQLQPGRYRFEGYPIRADKPGTAAAPITVRAARLDDAVIESNAVETFKVAAPFWRFENLTMRGVCPDHTDCEHALHVVGAATDIVIRNNRFGDYNAQIKVNGEGGQFPDRGVIEGNTLTDTTPRVTTNPVTPIDLVAASDWRVSNNFIADFARGVEGRATYGAFFKGAGERNVFQRNLVVCEWKLHDGQNPHVGLSLGGGGTDPGVSRDLGRTGFEQIAGVIRDNLIVMCNDDGIYLNRAARSLVSHNTLLDTAGIDARFVETSATIDANIVDGVIHGRDGASVRRQNNAAPFLPVLFAGLHPQRGYFTDPATLDLTWRNAPDRLPGQTPAIDLCGRQTGVESRPGAFDDFAFCLAAP